MPAELLLPAPLLARITAHAEAAWPEECCGVLVGRRGHEGRPALVERLVEAENEAPAERSRRYVIPPRLLLDVHREARETRRDVVGYYHSHPGRPAEPSAYDLGHAWPEVSYLIVGLRDGRAVEVRSWRLAAEGEGFREESLSHET